ncbi:MAG TPA: S8 family serine peptidase [Baekduia sp.]|uniref:S8 family peptidase n=1 Tax=Baekduia sp. TaxID=2600305 RepID=UPI002CBC879C|nr:S8 family serine peptidase [Baekduia sp.]HMJ33683.1 S8 family serine peptidase [Baekduia sp.]
MPRTTLSHPVAVVVLALLLLAAPAGGAEPRWQAADHVPHALPAPGAHAAAAGPARWIVGARPGAAADRIAGAHGARPLRLAGAYSVPAARARALAAALRARGLLRYSQADTAVARSSAYEGNGLETGWARGPVVAPDLVPPATPGTIGIVDDVVDASLPDVSQARLLKGSATTQVLDGHGTEVASAAAAQLNGTGVVGIMPGAPLLSFGLKDLSCAEAVNGILAAAEGGARVLNLSFGATEDCFALQLAVADAFATNTLVVAAAGNEFGAGNPIVYPAAYPHVLSVAALDMTLAAASFSTANAAVDLAAPGESVPVAVPLAFDLDGTADGITRADGTSFAAPIVSGVASWLIGARPGLEPGQYSDMLRRSARDLGAPGWDKDTGFGLVNLAAALQAPTPPVDPLEPNDGISFVDGAVFSKPDKHLWDGGAAKTVTAAVDPVEDPVDVYRVRIKAHRQAKFTLTPSAGNADLRVYPGKAKSLAATPLAKSQRGTGHADVVRVGNHAGRAATYYVAIVAPSLAARSFDAPYTLKLARG